MWNTTLITSIVVLGCVSSAPQARAAQGYPDRPIRMIVAYSPGGTTDFTARAIGPKMSEVLGQSVIIDNRPGAGSTIGTAIVANASKDGFTLLLADTTFGIIPAVYSKPPFDTARDFIPVTHIMSVGNCLVINPSLPVQTVKELVALARAKPNTLTFGSGGVSTPLHMAGEQLKLVANIDIVHVPYKGAGPALTDLMGGQLTMIFPTITSAASFVAGKRLRALAVTGKQRSPGLPGVPTMAEAGYPGVSAASWFGLLAPAGTPTSVVNTLVNAMGKVLADPEVQERFRKQYADVVSSGPDAFARFLSAETAQWRVIAKKAGVKIN